MHTQPTPSPDPRTLRFGCGYCGDELEVSVDYAGVEAPCPGCGNWVMAPPLSAYENLVAPFPDVSPHAPTQPYEPAYPEPPLPEVITKGVGVYDPFGPGLDSPSTSRAQTGYESQAAKRDRMADALAAAFPPAAPTAPVPALSGARRTGRMGKFMDAGLLVGLVLVACTGGVVWFFSNKGKNKPDAEVAVAVAVPEIPADLTQQVKEKKAAVQDRREVAVHEARVSVQKFLEAPSSKHAMARGIFLGDAAPLPWPAYPGLSVNDLKTTDCSRILGSENYVTTLAAADGKGPVFLVEQTKDGSFIHMDALEQQNQQRATAFLSTPGTGTAELYVRWKAAPDKVVADLVAQRPDLKPYRFAHVEAAFPEQKPAVFVAAIGPTSAVAEKLTRAAGTEMFSRVRLDWRQHREAGPFIELSALLPQYSESTLAGTAKKE